MKCPKCNSTKLVSVPGGHGDTDSIPCDVCDPHDCRGFPLCKKCRGLGYVNYTGERKPCSECQLTTNQARAANGIGPVPGPIAHKSDDCILALASTIQVMAEIGECKMAVKLAQQLSHIIGV